MRARFRWLLDSLTMWVRRFRHQHRAMASYDAGRIESGSPVDRFRDNEDLPLKGYRWRVVKRVGGPEPVLLLQPIAPTVARMKIAGARGKRMRRQLEQRRATHLRQIAEAQAQDQRQVKGPFSR